MENLIPHPDHLEVIIITSTPQEVSALLSNDLKLRMEVINSVPVICFVSQVADVSFFIHLNFPELRFKGTGWVVQEMISLKLVLKDAAVTDLIVGTRSIQINPEDSMEIKSAMYKQKNLTAGEVNAAVDHLYDAEFPDQEFLRY